MDTYDKAYQMLMSDFRYFAFRDILYWLNYEMVEGDILEFGVGAGASLLLFALFNAQYQKWPEWLGDKQKKPIPRRIVGFDSFEGLPTGEGHVRWHESVFKNNERLNHPFLAIGEAIKPEHIVKLFDVCGYEAPILEVGLFSDTVPKTIPAKYNKAALIHIDSDLYESCKTVLAHVEPLIQDGTVIMFDEWFAFKGNPNKGEARAFREFLEVNPHIQAIPYKQYSISSNAFILQKTNTTAGF